MSNGKLTGTEFRNEFLRSLNILAPRIARAIEIYGEDTVDVVNFASSGTATLNNLSVTGLTDIVSTATTEDVLDITADSLTTANVIDISADALTTGTILNLVSDSSDANVRSLVKIKNDNTSATRVSLLELVNDAATTAASSGEVVITTGATAGTVMNITADSLLTGTVMDVTADGLTTGSILNLVSDSSDTNARSLVTIKNDNTAATATTLLHLINDSTSASADMIIESTDADAAAAPKMHFLRNSASPAVDDVLGKLLFSGKDDAGNTTLYASMRAEINDETDSGGQEDGVIVFDIIKNNSQKSVLELKNNEAVFNNGGADIDFRIESDDETHMFFIDGNENRVSIGDSTDTPTATLEVTNHATAGAYNVPLVQLNSNDTDQIALDINAANIDAAVIDITADAVTTAHVMNISADALTTGFAVNIVSDSSDNSSRTLLKVLNDNSSASGASAASFETHAVQSCITVNNDNTETNFGPILTVNRKSSTVADDMGVGLINFQGLTDGGTSNGFARISAEASDVSDATPQGKLVLRAQLNIDGSEPNAVEELMSLGGGVGADGAGASVIINDLSYDIDFRVESNDETHMLFVDGGNNRVSIGDSTDAPAATLEVTNHASAGATGVPLVELNNNDVDQTGLSIEHAGTTGAGLFITASSLTTGKALGIYSNSSSTSTRDLMRIRNDNTAADATTLLRLMNDADPDDTAENATMVIEHTFNANGRANLALTSTNSTGTAAPALALQKTTTSLADDDFVGIVRYQGLNSNNDLHEFCSIVCVSSDVTDGDEGGLLNFNMAAGGTAGTSTFTTLFSIGGEDVANSTVPAVVVNEAGINCDFRVESDDETHMLFIEGSTNRMSIGDSTDSPAATLEISNASDGGVPLVLLDSNDTDKICLDIDAANIDADVIDITADAVTTAFVMDVTADGLTTGGVINITSNSSLTGDSRSLIKVLQDHANPGQVHLLHLKNDAQPDASGESTALIEHAGGGNNLELRYSGTNTGKESQLLFSRPDTTSEADDMNIGFIAFDAANDNNDIHRYIRIMAEASDVSDGDEGAKLAFYFASGGTAGTSALNELFTIGGEDVANTVVPAVVVNEAGINCDFRVESDGEDEAIFLDASAETLYINKGESAFATQIHSTNDVAMTVGAAGVIFNEDGHATNDFRVESDAFSNMLFVDAGADAVQVVGSTAGLSICQDGFTVVNDFNDATFETKIVAGKHGSAEVLRYSPGADDTLTSGQLYFLHTDGTWNSTDADAVATGATQMLGVGLGDSARTVGCLIKGFISIPSTEILNLPGSGACDGLPLYVSTTTGHFDFTAPSGNGDFVRIVGYAIDDDSSNVLVYFNPDATHVEITA